MLIKNNCLICGKHRGFGTNHKKCSIEIQKQMGGQGERKKSKGAPSKKWSECFKPQ